MRPRPGGGRKGGVQEALCQNYAGHSKRRHDHRRSRGRSERMGAPRPRDRRHDRAQVPRTCSVRFWQSRPQTWTRTTSRRGRRPEGPPLAAGHDGVGSSNPSCVSPPSAGTKLARRCSARPSGRGRVRPPESRVDFVDEIGGLRSRVDLLNRLVRTISLPKPFCL